MLFDYDDNDIKSIYSYAKKLESRTFRDIKKEFDDSGLTYYLNPRDSKPVHIVKESKTGYTSNSKAKGQLGGFLERYYFGYQPNSHQGADFEKVGIELKQTCIDLTKKGEYRAGERLSITNISYKEPVVEDFYASHVWEKIKKILLVHYLRDKSKDRMDYQIKFVNLFTPPQKDLDIIIQDYKKINDKIKQGKAHELSESDTLYLGACTKGSTAIKSMQPQYYGEHILAKKRNFCFKQSYMNYVLKNYILTNNVPYESIIHDASSLGKMTFEEYIIHRIEKYVGKTDKELCEMFEREYNNNEAQWSHLAYLMLGIKGNHAEEFEKAGIVVKAIRIEKNNTIKENMSIPPFKFKELVQETWENSTLFNYFDTTRFLFVIYKSDGDCYKLIGSQLWNMPYNDLNKVVKAGWENIKQSLLNGVRFTLKQINNGVRVENSLPKKKDNPILHIRPHAQKSAYLLKDGTQIGDLSNANELPDGQWMTTQSFWINNTYLYTQLNVLKKSR
ncbi:Sau3AI family type II restriction endonuclease [Massilimicrobiota sp. An105]|uniref:Sau3AI family type II restriction endonuclease n=1 Tax=Massilimicrobiota sp. An105 TaxID=1965540 RepID=UPI0019D12374|nr:Sau3AI family type II restriction endonuclease [Massilimicrobiota sp. An105]